MMRFYQNIDSRIKPCLENRNMQKSSKNVFTENYIIKAVEETSVKLIDRSRTLINHEFIT